MSPDQPVSSTMTGITGDGRAPPSADTLPKPTATGRSFVLHGDDDPTSPSEPMNPGDDAPDGAPGTGENLCPRCNGSGRVADGPCPDCDGTGKVTSGIGGG